MTRTRPASAPKGAAGSCRERRRPRGERPPGWVRPFRRASHALHASVRLISSTLRTVAASERRARRRPVRTSRELHEASALLVAASARLVRVGRELGAMNQCLGREPESAGDAPLFLVEATEYWTYVTAWLGEVADDLSTVQEDVLNGLESGTLVPEPPPGPRRPRIVLAPRPAPVRAFLAARRQPRAADRIAAILSRRRRTPRPAAARVPRRSHTGRAPPLVSTCSF